MKSRHTKNLNTKKSNRELFDGFSSGCFFYAHYYPIHIEEECFLPLGDKKGVPPVPGPRSHVFGPKRTSMPGCPLQIGCQTEMSGDSSVELEDRIVTAMIKTFTTVMRMGK